uniref:Small ribosomal subunit protein uS3c n=1 Tax=Asparagopsis taxiformis TaxID=260499 RepID=A0A1C9CCG5_9FLOR|nr:ribosomal protein S3 [Asparagopsis taxiformis]AOM66076.1 ribosomal protein S3 [Asparagopsis taxiformis]
MGQKTHPLGFRIGITQQHKSFWFANKTQYPNFLQEDYIIRSYIANQLNNANIANIKIHRKVDQTEIEIETARPGIILGRMGSGIDTLRKNLMSRINSNIKLRINIIEITDPDTHATLIAEFITQQLEKRIAFRRAVRQGIQRAQKANIEGIKIQVSGRLNGAEIARSEWVREGRVPLQTLRANIDYSYKTANTIYGILGVKVWLFKGEKLPKANIIDNYL